MRVGRSSLCMAMALVTLSACKPPAVAGPMKTLSAGYSLTGAAFAPLYAAADGGYFDREGLDVHLTQVQSGAPILAAVQSGEVPIVMSGAQQFIEASLSGADFVLVAGFADKLVTSIYVVPSIQTKEDLKGKSIGVPSFGSIQYVSTVVAIEQLGLTDQVNIVTTGEQSWSLAAAQAGKVDAIAIGPPDTLRARQAGLHELISLARLNVHVQTAAIVTTRHFAQEQPEIVERFIRAVLRGSRRVRTDKAFALHVLSSYTKLDDPQLLEETYQAEMDLDQWGKDGVPSLAGVQGNLAFAAPNIARARTARPEQFVDLSFAERIHASGLIDELWGAN